MDGSKILGIIIIIVLILSFGVVGYSAIIDNNSPEESIINTEYSFDESDLNDTDYYDDSVNSSISKVNLNINQKAGSVDIEFSDNMTDIYNISAQDEENSTTNITTSQNRSKLDVNVESNASDYKIVLNSKYKYDINVEAIGGGFTTDITEGASINELNINYTTGGVDINFNGGSLNTSNIRITTGGLNIIGEPSGETTINSEIEIGGLNLQCDKAIADIFTNIEVGGINPGDYQQVSENEYKGIDFDSSENKLIINNNIKLGGVNTQILPN